MSGNEQPEGLELSTGHVFGEDDAEGHGFRFGVMDDDTEGDDTEGHGFREAATDQGDDTEGHSMRVRVMDEGDDTEGDDAEGHTVRGRG